MARSIKQIEGDETVHYISPRAKRGREKARISVPMTAMIDVTFQLLIYFILTTTFRMQEGQIPGTLPKAGSSRQSAAELPVDPITITLVQTGPKLNQIRFEVSQAHETIETPKRLYEVLAKLKEKQGKNESPIIIKAGRTVRWKHVVEVFNQIVANDYKNIAFQNTT